MKINYTFDQTYTTVRIMDEKKEVIKIKTIIFIEVLKLTRGHNLVCFNLPFISSAVFQGMYCKLTN